MTDGELLARFVADRDEVAFEGLVARLGPMVLGVARRMLGDRGEADDAFQATFLVLVRRAGAVGRGDLIGPWLHGVAVRVCRKARAQAARRRGRERADAGGTLEIPAPPAPALAGLAGAETLATIDAEIARLPESYRRLVVLCDVEGLSRDEAADRLGWTPNMVRGRLARARSQLRANLARRGCTPPGHAGAEGWGALPWLLTPSPSAVLITARAALATLSPPGRGATLLASASALSLAQGVTRTMTLTSWKFAGFGLLAAGTLAAGTAGAILAQASAVPGPPATAVAPRRAEAIPPVDAPLQALLEERLRNAQGRFDAQFNFYRNARTDDIGRVIDASRQVMQARLGLVETPEQRRAAIQAHLDRGEMILAVARALSEAARVAPVDVAEAEDVVNEARILLAQQDRGGPLQAPLAAPIDPPAPSASLAAATKKNADGMAVLRQAQLEIARRNVVVAERFYPGELPAVEYLAARRNMNNCELAAATTPAGRAAAHRSLIEVAQQLVVTTQALARLGEKKQYDVDLAKVAVLELQTLAANDAASTDPATADLDRRLTELERKVDRVLDMLGPAKR